MIKAQEIKNAVADLCLKANLSLRSDILRSLKRAHAAEANIKAKKALAAIIENAARAKKEKLAICQDTGLPIVFLEIGQDLRVAGDLNKAVIAGVEAGYKLGYFRKSIISDPLKRGKPGYSGAVIHADIVPGKRLKITLLAKGFGCENKSRLKMFNPTAKIGEIKKFIIEAIKSAGSDACPPYILGVGIGGTADYASLLAKKALLSVIDHRPSAISALEKELLKEINKLKIGPMGLGGNATCLGVNIETAPTHIAGLPVSVNISCHALRSASVIL